MKDQRDGVRRPFEYLRDIGNRFTGGGLRVLAKRVLTAGLRRAIRRLDPEEVERARQARDEVIKARIILAQNRSETNVRKLVASSAGMPSLFGCRTMRQNGRIAVVLHLHYTELWPEFEQAISSVSEPFDLFVSLTAKEIEVEERIRQRFPQAQILHFENRGRDILPFVALVNSGILFRYQLVCKIHSKRSLHRNDGDLWRRVLLDGILGTQDLVSRIVAAFDGDPDLGIIVAEGQIYGWDQSHWAGNLDRLRSYAPRIGIYDMPTDLPFPGGSMYWIRPLLLRQIGALKLAAEDFEPEPVPADGTTAHAVERLLGLICHDAGMRIIDSSNLPKTTTANRTSETYPPLIAFYLPQFHSIPENDLWWGTGFTEWTNVTRAVSKFRHHQQPRLPADLGFYDLRLPEARQAQADLAKRYGISAFCYYYYWFNGRRLLQRPLDEVIQNGAPDFPFLICWANESWTSNWDGGNREVLVPQTYEDGWQTAFARDIAPIVQDRRYFRVGGKPLLLIYRITNIPDCARALYGLRIALRKAGVEEVQIAGGWFDIQGDTAPPANPRKLGIDNYYEFPPHGLSITEITDAMPERDPNFTGNIYSYDSAIESTLTKLNESPNASRYRGVMVSWDNTPRRLDRSHIIHGATPAKFRRWLREVVKHEAELRYGQERPIFINAWNEWAEGAYLEPDQEYGHGWLEAVASAVGIKCAPKDDNKQSALQEDFARNGQH